MPYGREDSEWDELVEMGYDLLSKMAENNDRPISYTMLSHALADGMNADHRPFVFPQDRQAIGTLLANISKRGIQEHPGWLLSALVTGKGSDMPGGGFFDLAKSLGMLSESARLDEKVIFFGNQLEGLWNTYQRSRTDYGRP